MRFSTNLTERVNLPPRRARHKMTILKISLPMLSWFGIPCSVDEISVSNESLRFNQLLKSQTPFSESEGNTRDIHRYITHPKFHRRSRLSRELDHCYVSPRVKCVHTLWTSFSVACLRKPPLKEDRKSWASGRGKERLALSPVGPLKNPTDSFPPTHSFVPIDWETDTVEIKHI